MSWGRVDSIKRHIGSGSQSAEQPRVWLLLSQRAGDSVQVLALAEALGWPYEIRSPEGQRDRAKAAPIRIRPPVTSRPRVVNGTSVASVGNRQPDACPTGAWPDVIISTGWKNELRSRRLRARAARDGADVRLVHLGRPWFSRDAFDLVVTPPQYRLPGRDHILQNKTTLHAVTQQRLDAAARAWAPSLAHLPRPFISVLIGGHSGPFNFGADAALRLARDAARLARERGGTLLISTSARTPDHVRTCLAEKLDVPHFLYEWTPGDSNNPYYAFLALGDELVVTCDSVSMLTDACATRKPVHIFDLDESRGMASIIDRLGRRAEAPGDRRKIDRDRLRSDFYKIFMSLGPRRFTRDIRLVHHHLLETKRAVWLGEGLAHWQEPAPLDSVRRAVARVQSLFDIPVTRPYPERLASPGLSLRKAS